MDKNLFEKYSKKIDSQKERKDEIIRLIEEYTDITLTKEEVSLENTTITLNTTSVKRTILHNKKIRDFLVEKGYSISL